MNQRKCFERIIVDDCAFSQPADETKTLYTLQGIINRLRSITPLEQQYLHTTTRLFDYDTDTYNALSGIKAPEFFFPKQNLFTVLNEVFKYKNAGIARVDSFSPLPVIKKIYLIKRQRLFDLAKIFNISETNNGEYFTKMVDMDIANGITVIPEVFPPYPNLATLTTESLVMSTNDLVLILPKPIYAIKKLIMVLRYKPVDTNFTYRDIDLTIACMRKQMYDLLPVQEAGQPSKYGSLVYKKGDNKILNFGVAYPQLFGLFSTRPLNRS